MPIGVPETSDALNSMAETVAQKFASAAAEAIALQAWVVANGANGLANAGFTTGDAATFTTDVSYLNNMAQILNGSLAQATPFNFLLAVNALIGPASQP